MDEEAQVEEIKLAINNLIWMYAGKKVTLEEAEDLACRFLNQLIELNAKPRDQK